MLTMFKKIEGNIEKNIVGIYFFTILQIIMIVMSFFLG